MATSREQIIRDVLDEDESVRKDAADEYTDARLALQIKALRQQRGWTQEQLARRAGLGQSQVSDYENVNNSSWTAATLKKLAAAFDLPVLVSFGSWGEFVDATADLSRGALERPAREDDASLQRQLVQATVTGRPGASRRRTGGDSRP